jgi:hypothetical protein
MAGDQRQFWHLAIDDMQIGAANRACGDLDQHLPLGSSRLWDI